MEKNIVSPCLCLFIDIIVYFWNYTSCRKNNRIMHTSTKSFRFFHRLISLTLLHNSTPNPTDQLRSLLHLFVSLYPIPTPSFLPLLLAVRLDDRNAKSSARGEFWDGGRKEGEKE